jgi:hypothetical protein
MLMILYLSVSFPVGLGLWVQAPVSSRAQADPWLDGVPDGAGQGLQEVAEP